MDLPHVLGFMQKKEEKKDWFLSLVLDIDSVIANLWSTDDKHAPKVVSTVTSLVVEDSWDARLSATEEAVGRLDVEADTTVSKVILGLPSNYLTKEGDILQDIRPHLKKLTRTMELSPIGFVSIHQAIIHELKKEEGVPPTVILTGIADGRMTVFVYKIGTLVGQKQVALTDAVADFEAVIHGFTELEVLPSRILLYGGDSDRLEELKRDFLRHHWTSRANFMHFPKIDVLTHEKLAESVALVGASELATTIAPDAEVAEESAEVPPEVAGKKEELISQEEESNVVLVDPVSLGFQKSVDVRKVRRPQPIPSKHQEKIQLEGKTIKPKISIPTLPAFSLPHIALPTTARIPLIAGIGIVFIVFTAWVLYWFIPRASVTINEVPKQIQKSETIVIDPVATVADPSSKTLPGKKQEKTEMGDKAIPVTSKKQIGDPAKGVVTIYNKTTDSRSFSAGTVVASGGLQFTLDTDVSVASASENLAASNLTYGKANVGITAKAIGNAGNLSAGTDFTFTSTSSDVAVARNDSALAGGNSKDVTVVTRADQDALVTTLTKELVDKAKTELSGSVLGDETIIDPTVKTSVVDKSFVEDLDQQATSLHGKVSLSVSGLSYNKSDLIALMTGIASSDIPGGYTIDEKNTKVTLKDITVKKDGKITATADFEGTATPKLDLPDIAKHIAGKSVSAAQDYLKSIPGVGGADVRLKISLFAGRLPANIKNISLSIAAQE